jgi:DNA polymerase III subunit epsilon
MENSESPDVAFVVIDLETSGLSPRWHHVLQLALVRLTASGEVIDEWSTYIRPRFGRFARVGPTRIHGLTVASLQSAPVFRVVAKEITRRIGNATVVGHNVDFDWSFLQRALRSAGEPPLHNPRLCTLLLSRSLDPQRLVRHRLATVCERYGVALTNAHDALADAHACAGVLPLLLEDTGLTLATLPTHRAYRRSGFVSRKRSRLQRWFGR